MSIFDRIALSVSALAYTSVSFLFLLCSLGWDKPVKFALDMTFLSTNGRILVGTASGLLFITGIRFIILGFKGQGRSAVAHDSEFGEVKISLLAVKNLVTRVARRTSGVREVRSDVTLSADGSGVTVSLDLKVAVDANLPDLADKLQKAVSSYVKEIVGVNVEAVKVSISDIALETRR